MTWDCTMARTMNFDLMLSYPHNNLGAGIVGPAPHPMLIDGCKFHIRIYLLAHSPAGARRLR